MGAACGMSSCERKGPGDRGGEQVVLVVLFRV